MSQSQRRLFCFGLGYSARALGRQLLDEGWQVAGTTRSEASAERLRAEGFEIHLFDKDRPLADPAAALGAASHLLSSVPPEEAGDPVIEQHRAAILSCAGLEWIGYLSTVGVYGGHDGAWIDESAELRPKSTRSVRRVAAEQAWLDFAARSAALISPSVTSWRRLRFSRQSRS